MEIDEIRANIEKLNKDLDELKQWADQPVERICHDAPISFLQKILKDGIENEEYEFCALISKAIEYRNKGLTFTVTRDTAK